MERRTELLERMQQFSLCAVALLFLVIAGSAGAYADEASCGGGPSSSFRLGGEVQNPKTINLQELSSMPNQTTVQDAYLSEGGIKQGEFTGVLLWDLINSAGVLTNSNIKHDLSRKYVLVTGSDCYQQLFSIGELAPSIDGSHQVTVAYKENGQLLTTDGFAILVAPSDKGGTRRVHNIIRIEVFGPKN